MTLSGWRLGWWWVAVGLVGPAVAAGPAVATAPTAPTALTDCGPYRVGLKQYPLVYERDPERDGAYRGLDKDFFALLAERSGCRFELELESQPRIWARLRAGSLDLTSWALPTAERQTWAHFIPLVRTSPVALVRRVPGVASEADFLARRELRAVVVRDASYGPGYDGLLQALRAEGRVSEVGDIESALRAFLVGRVDLLISYPWVVAAALREQGASLMLADWHPQAAGALSSLALSQRTVRPADQRRVLEALQSLQRDGSLERLLRQHLPRVGLTPLSRIELLPGEG